MIDILINLLTPIVESMGASASDLAVYMNALSGYVYAVLGLVAALIAVMIGAHFVKKGSRLMVRWTSVVAFVLAILMIVNMICYGPMYNTVSTFLNGAAVEISDDVVGNSLDVIEQTGDEGMVLVKNNGLLPLKSDVDTLNVFGWASMFPIYGGTGSSDNGSSASDIIDIIGSLNNAGYATNESLSKMYTDYYPERPAITMYDQNWSLPEPNMSFYTNEVMNNATSFSDTAVIVIGRSGGENADLPTDMKAVIDGTYNLANTDAVLQNVKANYGYTAGTFIGNSYDYYEFEEGQHYLELSHTEKDLVELVCSSFENVIVVINANNTMELSWVDEYDSIGAVILAPGTGATGMAALGKILNGTVNPSGKTVDTYVRDLTSVINWNHSTNSGNNLYTNVSDLQRMLGREDSAYQGVLSFTDYVEGIYTGYKYYETASDDGVIDYYSEVQYPFGYGLSYTTFTQEITAFKQSDKAVTLEVTVTNTGDVAGKDVVELYYTPPYTNGGIEKASVNLIDFGKTKLLEPGESQTISFTIALEDMASYDSSCIKTENGGYVLEAGEYIMSIRSDSHTVLDSETFTLDADVDYSKEGRSTDAVAAQNLFSYMESDHEILSRKDGFANYDAAAVAPGEAEFELSKDDQTAIKEISILKYDPTDYDNPDDVMPTTGAANGLTLADLAGKDYDDENWDKLLDQMTIDDMITLINMGGYSTAAIDSVGKVATSECDGPAGLSNYMTGAAGTKFPTEVLMAQTWSKEIAEKIGDAMGQEFANADNYGWYGPAMNMHRSAFSGRNFEYYSEDSVLSGLFASEQVNAAAKYGVYAYIKHFAANDQETNRCAFLMTYMTEQTFREYCLKPFELVVKNFDFNNNVMGMMASYNFLGTVPVSSSYELLTSVLRDEWGFVGTVISDYNGSYGYQISDAFVRAGGDLMLGFGMAESNQFTDTDAATCVIAMRRACKNILYTTANSGYYADASSGSQEGISTMDQLFLTVNISVVLLAIALEAIVLLPWLKKRKQAAK